MAQEYLSDEEIVERYESAENKAAALDALAVACRTTRGGMLAKLMELDCVETEDVRAPGEPEPKRRGRNPKAKADAPAEEIRPRPAAEIRMEPRAQERREDDAPPLTVAGFRALLAMFMTPAMDAAELQIMGRPVRDVYGIHVSLRGGSAVVDLITEALDV